MSLAQQFRQVKNAYLAGEAWQGGLFPNSVRMSAIPSQSLHASLPYGSLSKSAIIQSCRSSSLMLPVSGNQGALTLKPWSNPFSVRFFTR